MKKCIPLLTCMVVLLFAACSKKSTSGKSVKEEPTVYAANVLPLIQVKCTPCHLPSKGGFKADFENYTSAIKYGTDMLTRIQLNPGERGFMPFKHEKLSADEITIFKKWVAGGMLEK